MIELLERGFADGSIVDLALAVLAFEALALVVLRSRRPASSSLRRYAFGLAAGACLLLLVRLHAAHAPWTWQALALAGAGACHALDLAARRRA